MWGQRGIGGLMCCLSYAIQLAVKLKNAIQIAVALENVRLSEQARGEDSLLVNIVTCLATKGDCLQQGWFSLPFLT